MGKCVLLEKLGLRLIWFDSLGAKSSSIYVESSRGGILIDPGAAVMQPSYPLTPEEKRNLKLKALREIEKWAKKSKIIVITHYHYDHHKPPLSGELDPNKTYIGKTIIVKNPNILINANQWRRARAFFHQLLETLGTKLEEYLEEPQEVDINIENEIEEAVKQTLKLRGRRGRKRLEKGREWLNKLKSLWSRTRRIPSRIEVKETKIILGDKVEIEYGNVKLKMLGSWFHGEEYARTGWVTPILIEKENTRILYTSDLMGPIVEDYTYKIVDLKPDIIIADGPATYLYPYMLGKINLQRAINNMIHIVENLDNIKLIIYDHHLLRERKWRERVSEVFKASEKRGVRILTAAEYMGRKPLIDTL